MTGFCSWSCADWLEYLQVSQNTNLIHQSNSVKRLRVSTSLQLYFENKRDKFITFAESCHSDSIFCMTCIYQVQVHAPSKDFCRSRFYRVWISVLCVLYRWRYHTQLCPDDRTRGQKLAGIMCLHLRMGSRGSSTNTRRSRHTTLALAGGSDVIYVPPVNWYIFVSTTTRSWNNV